MVHYVQNVSESSLAFFRKSFTKSLRGFQSFWLLHVEIVPRHIDFCVTHDILDGLDVHAQRLHLRNKGMPATMWRQYTDTLDPLQSLFELGSEVGWVTGHVRPAGFPDEFLLGVPQVPGTVLS